MDYYKYINSQEWKEKTRLFAAIKCEFCGSTKRLQTHHRHYDTLGEELPEDLISLCRSCHKAIHITKDGMKIKRWQSGSELYYKASKQGWKIKGWKKQQKVDKFLKRKREGGSDYPPSESFRQCGTVNDRPPKI